MTLGGQDAKPSVASVFVSWQVEKQVLCGVPEVSKSEPQGDGACGEVEPSAQPYSCRDTCWLAPC